MIGYSAYKLHQYRQPYSATLRHTFRVYVYDITMDGTTKRYERMAKLDYKKTIEALKASGHTDIWIKLVDSYLYEE